MRLVVDARVAIRWFVDEEFSERAGALLEREYDLFAPRLLASEVGNALWRKVRMGESDHDEALEIADSLPRIPVSWADELTVCSDAVRLSLDWGHPVYDCFYLALARQLDASMVTSDARSANAVTGTAFGHLILTQEKLDLA